MTDLDTKYVLVPREPTQEMLDAGGFYFIRHAGPVGTLKAGLARDTYRRMIAAAPTPPKPTDEVAGVVKRLRGLAEQIRIDDLPAMPGIEEQSGAMAEAATLLEAFDAELRALRSPGD